jgi:hypothetical protein
MKRVLMLAAEENYEGIAWTTGRTQIERYPGSGYILNKVQVEKRAGSEIVEMEPIRPMMPDAVNGTNVLFEDEVVVFVSDELFEARFRTDAEQGIGGVYTEEDIQSIVAAPLENSPTSVRKFAEELRAKRGFGAGDVSYGIEGYQDGEGQVLRKVVNTREEMEKVVGKKITDTIFNKANTEHMEAGVVAIRRSHAELGQEVQRGAKERHVGSGVDGNRR